MNLNEYGQEIGDSVKDFSDATLPSTTPLVGQFCCLEKVSLKHFDDLYKIYGPKSHQQQWTYLNLEQSHSPDQFMELLNIMIVSKDPFYYAIVDKSNGVALGTLALMRIQPSVSSIEVGMLVYGDALKRTRIATEAQFLLAEYVFESLNYRRYEWKCDSLNKASRNAALRLGFTYEGTFRNASVYKGRNRDTAWFAMISDEWHILKAGYKKWLEPSNFDSDKKQISILGLKQISR